MTMPEDGPLVAEGAAAGTPVWVEVPPGHQWTKFAYDRHRRRWYRHCTIGDGNCVAVESVPRGMRPKGQ